MPKLVDIHCHLDFPEFSKDREEVIKRALDNDVWMINIGTDLETSKKSIELAEKHEGVFASVGIHPHYVNEGFSDEFRELAGHPKVAAMGECGLDKSQKSNLKSQKEMFKKQIELALEVNKPLMIHCRDAHDEVLEILKSYISPRPPRFAGDAGGNRKSYNGNVHFFSGKWKHAEQYLKLGFSFSFTGLITYIKDCDKIIKKLPLEKIMVETDSPFVAPVPHRGQRCEPLYVKEVAKRIAEIRGMSYDEVAEITTKNALRFFNLA